MVEDFEQFFKTNYREVESRVRSAGATADVAAEATQEAFTRAYQRWWRLGHYRCPAAWVQKVALNHRRDLERKQQRQNNVAAKVVANLGVQPVVETETTVAETDPRLAAAVEALPAQQQAAVQAYYHDGLSTQEAADRMGLSSGAVRFHLSQARNNLRPALTPDATHQEL